MKDGSYKVARPFNVVAGQNLSDVAQDFLNFIMSSDGQAVVSEENYVSVADDAQPYTASGKSAMLSSPALFRDPRHGEARRGIPGPEPRCQH